MKYKVGQVIFFNGVYYEINQMVRLERGAMDGRDILRFLGESKCGKKWGSEYIYVQSNSK